MFAQAEEKSRKICTKLSTMDTLEEGKQQMGKGWENLHFLLYNFLGMEVTFAY